MSLVKDSVAGAGIIISLKEGLEEKTRPVCFFKNGLNTHRGLSDIRIKERYFDRNVD